MNVHDFINYRMEKTAAVKLKLSEGMKEQLRMLAKANNPELVPLSKKKNVGALTGRLTPFRKLPRKKVRGGSNIPRTL